MSNDTFTKEQLLAMLAAVEEQENKQKEDKSKFTSDRNDDEDNAKKKSPEYQIERAIEYLYESYDLVLGEDGALYWGEKGTHVMHSDDETLKNRVGVYSQEGTITALKSVREDSIFFVKDNLKRDVDNKIEKVYAFQPRVLRSNDCSIWLDTGSGHYNSTASGTAGFVKINNDGTWEMNAKPNNDIFFYRNRNVGAIEVSDNKGIAGIEKLFNHINIPEEMKGNIVAFIVNSVVEPDADQPLLFIQGEQGNGKTTSAERIKQIFFPTVGHGEEESKSGLPDSTSDLNAILKQDGLPFYDNVTGISLAMSDALCRVATGAGLSTRKLYTDSDLAQSKYRRPQIMTSVDQITMRPDLQTRAIFIDPPRLREGGGKYQLGTQMRQQWFRDLPDIRSAFLTLCAEVMKRKAEKIAEAQEMETQLEFTTRLSDFEFTSMVCDEILTEVGIFPEGYDSVAARADAQAELRAASVPGVIEFLISCDEIDQIGPLTAEPLSAKLREIARDTGRDTTYFPKSGRGLSPALNDNMEVIKEHFDVEIEVDSRSGRKYYTFKKIDSSPSTDSGLFEEAI